jgi:hypothetical protein
MFTQNIFAQSRKMTEPGRTRSCLHLFAIHIFAITTTALRHRIMHSFFMAKKLMAKMSARNKIGFREVPFLHRW